MKGKEYGIIEYYGFFHQAEKLCEECGELISAMMRYNLEPREEQRNNLLGELADVQVVWRQIVAYMSAEEDVNRIMDRKSNRQLERIKEEEEI